MPDRPDPTPPRPTFDDAPNRTLGRELDPYAALARLRLHRERREQARPSVPAREGDA